MQLNPLFWDKALETNHYIMIVTPLKKSTLFTFLTIAVMGLFSSFTVQSNSYLKNWKHLGNQRVNFGLDKDVIRVTASRGVFTKLKLNITNGSLNMHRMLVVYKNGSRQEIKIKQYFNRGSSSRVIDLKGNKRVVNRVIFWYDSKNRSRRKAVVHLYGKN